MPTITLLFAGVLGLISIWLAVGVGRARGQHEVNIGDGGSPEMLEAIRRHANFTEFVPLALILMGLLEMNGVHTYAVYSFGAVLTIARICHPLGLGEGKPLPLRAAGAGLTILLTLVMSIWAIVVYF